MLMAVVRPVSVTSSHYEIYFIVSFGISINIIIMFAVFYAIEEIMNIIKISAIFKYPSKVVKGICVKYFMCEVGTD